VDGGPGQERPHGVQIRPVDIAAHDRGLEGDASPAAEGIADAGRVAEAKPAQRVDQFGQAVRLRSQVGVDLLPGRIRGADDLFRTLAPGEFSVVAHPVKGPPLHVRPVIPGCRSLPLPFVRFPGEVEFPFRLGGKLTDLGGGNIRPHPVPESLLVHGHEFEKDLPILLRVGGGG